MKWHVTNKHEGIRCGAVITEWGNNIFQVKNKTWSLLITSYKFYKWLNSGWVISEVTYEANHSPSIDSIIIAVCDYEGLDIDAVLNKCRKRELVIARQICHHIAVNYTSNSLSLIGEKIGGLDHATVIYSNNTIYDLISSYSDFNNKIENIKKILNI